MVGKRQGCLGLRPSPPGRAALESEASLPDAADQERLAAGHSGRCTTHFGVVRAGMVSLPVAPSGNGELSAVPSRAVASMDLGAQAGEVEVPSEGLSPETGHVEDTCSDVRRDRLQYQRPTGDCHHRNSLVSRPLVLRRRELVAGALETPRRDREGSSEPWSPARTTEACRPPSDHAGRSRNRRGTPNTLGCGASLTLSGVLGGTQKVAAAASVQEACHLSRLGPGEGVLVSSPIRTEPFLKNPKRFPESVPLI